MAKLNVGFNFTQEHFGVLVSLIKDGQTDTPSVIDSIYGSPGEHNILGSVRERYREATPDLRRDSKMLLQLMRQYGIQYNLTLNSLVFPYQFGSTAFQHRLGELMEYFGPYVNNWVIAHPGLVDFFHKQYPTENIIISTIMNVHTIPQVQWIADNWPNVIRICPAIEKNRDFIWLKRAAAIVDLELLANEFCSMGGTDCEGLYRQMCYITQSANMKRWCARDKCIEQRRKNPVAWLQSRFILPQWMEAYEKIGIKHFKITGRTHGTNFLRYIAETYMSEKATGNLLQLWGQLEATKEGVDQKDAQDSALELLNIPIDILDDFDFTRCHADVCGIACKTCKNLWETYNEKSTSE